MSLQSITSRHLLRAFRHTVTSGTSGGRIQSVEELGVIKGTVNPDADFESPEFGTRNEEITASIYFSFDPTLRTNDFLQITSVMVNGGYKPVTNGPTYRVEAIVDFQYQNRLWRVKATKREAL